MLGYVQIIFEAIAFIVALIFCKELLLKGWGILLPILYFTPILEVWGTLLAEKKINNAWLYNPYIIISFGLYGWLLLKDSILKNQYKNLSVLFIALLSFSFFIWYFIWGNNKEIINRILNVTSLLICFFCILFYYTHLRKPAEYISILLIPGFWFSTGLLIFYSGISLYSSIYPYLAKARINISNIPIQNLIPQVLSMILYSFIIVSIIRCRKYNKIISSI